MKKIIIAITLIILPLIVSAQESAKKKAYYFFGEQCPHCQKVDEYFKENGIYDRYDITKLEFSNPFNARLLVKFGEVFKSEYKGSVPAIAFDSKFLVGDTPIIENFEKEIASVPATELPDPEKIGNQSASTPADAEALAGKGNKKYLFPVILAALAIVGAGAYAYVNRK